MIFRNTNRLFKITGATSLTLILFLFSITGCKEIDKLTHFNMSYDETITIPSTIGVNVPFNIITPNIKTNSEQTFEINDTRKDLIEEIVLKKMVLLLDPDQNKDFSFLKSIKIYINAEGLDKKLIAWKEDIDNSVGNTLELETASDDLKDYIKLDSFQLELTTVTDELILSDYDVNVHTEFFVDAKILGI